MLAGCESDSPAPEKVGDFYYSDNTYSSVLNPSKECIGIVFQTRTATGSGLVVSLEEYDYQGRALDDRWTKYPDGESAENIIGFIEGLENIYYSRYISIKPSEKLTRYWHVPSSDELKCLYEYWNSNREAFNARIIAAGGVKLSEGNVYWSSLRLYGIDFMNGDEKPYTADLNNKCRYVYIF